ncbi:MAG TPA: hypothetical protein VJP04_07885 [Terriglobales bacterium]|nr:hypothetical protein [Terriglobales bacterium]
MDDSIGPDPKDRENGDLSSSMEGMPAAAAPAFGVPGLIVGQGYTIIPRNTNPVAEFQGLQE